MSIVTSQQLTRYYEQYKTTDVTFNKQVITALGLVAKGVYLKIQDRQLPCIVFSSSMASARVIASVPGASLVFQAARKSRTDHVLRDVPPDGFHALRGAGARRAVRHPRVHPEAAGRPDPDPWIAPGGQCELSAEEGRTDHHHAGNAEEARPGIAGSGRPGRRGEPQMHPEGPLLQRSEGRRLRKRAGVHRQGREPEVHPQRTDARDDSLRRCRACG